MAIRKVKARCEECDGEGEIDLYVRGRWHSSEECPECGGTGKSDWDEEIEVDDDDPEAVHERWVEEYPPSTASKIHTLDQLRYYVTAHSLCEGSRKAARSLVGGPGEFQPFMGAWI